MNGGSEEESAREPTLTLSNALKLSGIALTGGQAKALIQEGSVKVNGAVERRRKHRVAQGDEIEVHGETFVIELQDEVEDEDEEGVEEGVED